MVQGCPSEDALNSAKYFEPFYSQTPSARLPAFDTSSCVWAERSFADFVGTGSGVQDCLRELWGKPVFWDQAAVARVDSSLCKAQPEKVDEALKAQHIVAFHISNALLLIQDAGFDKNNAPFNYLWKTPTKDIRVIPRATPGSRPPTDAELHTVADVVLKRSHQVRSHPTAALTLKTVLVDQKNWLRQMNPEKNFDTFFKDPRYDEVPGPKSVRPPPVPRASLLNAAGTKAMQQGDYQAAVAKFEEAAQLNSADPRFANNAGFAYYELDKYVESLYWFKKLSRLIPIAGSLI
jgi:tetratricopeptide (TPR) repeat protein